MSGGEERREEEGRGRGGGGGAAVVLSLSFARLVITAADVLLITSCFGPRPLALSLSPYSLFLFLPSLSFFILFSFFCVIISRSFIPSLYLI